MKRYRSKPAEVEAIQWTGDNVTDVLDAGAPVVLVGGAGDPRIELTAGADGAQGLVPVPVGHWIVRGGDPAHWWPVDPDHFAAKYLEAVES